MDGFLKIKTKIDNKDVDKGIVELENKIKKLQEDNSKSSIKQDSLQKEIDNYEELCNEAEKYGNTIKRLEEERKSLLAGGLKNSDVSRYDLVTSEIEQIKQKQAQVTSEIDKQAPKIEKVYSKLDKVKQKQTENNSKIVEFKNKIEQINMNKIQKSLDNVGKGIQKQISGLGKMAFAVIGIRTAFGAVKSLISSVSQYNSQVSADFEYMRFCIANALIPVVQWLVKLLYTALSYVNAIASAWFGTNLFANSSAKAFQKMQKGASGTAKSMKEIQKTLQGFDEMNIISDTNSGGVGVGGAIPSIDLSKTNIDIPIPGWLQFLIDNKNDILSILGGIVTFLGLIKFGVSGLVSLKIALLIMGIIMTISSLIDYLNDPSWENFGGIIQGVGVIIVALGFLILGVPGIVAGAAILIVGTIVRYWDQIKNFLQNGINWLKDKSNFIRDIFGDTVGDIYDSCIRTLQKTLDFFDRTFIRIKNIFDNIIQLVKNVFTGNWKGAWENIRNIFSNMWEQIKDQFSFKFSFIVDALGRFATLAGQAISSAFKAVINYVIARAESVLNKPIVAINSLINDINMLPGVNLSRLNTFTLPRLAKGGVIAQPTTAIIGEAGKEAVMPLENNLEWLDILATKIASKIDSGGGSFIINMDSRTIQKGIAKRQQELAFAKNGR